MMKKILILSAATLVLSSCGIYNKYKPVSEVPEGLYGSETVASADTANFGNLSWREVFGTEYGYADSASPCERSGGFVADVQAFLSALFVSRTGRSCEQLRPWQSDTDLLIAGDCLVGTGYLRKGDHGQTSGKSGL